MLKTKKLRSSAPSKTENSPAKDSNNHTLSQSQFNADFADSLAKTNHELVDRFTPKRKSAELLSETYQRLGETDNTSLNFLRKAQSVDNCGTILDFARPVTGGKWTLHQANFCRDRLCPLCSWRRSIKVYGQLSKVMNYLDLKDKYCYLFLTLTIKNVSGTDLSQAMDDLNSAYKALMRKPDFKAIKGYFRTIEVTRNKKRYSKSYGTYHPHIHAVLVVSKAYFTRDYLSQKRVLELWQDCFGDPSITQIDIRKVKPDFNADGIRSYAKAVAEVSKYAVKSSDYLHLDLDFQDDSVFTLSYALHSRRLITMGGVIRKAHSLLNLDDADSGDLVQVGADDEIREDVAQIVVRWRWGFGSYCLAEILEG